MKILYLLENLRNPVLDTAMLLITRLGEETAFLVAALIVFWCVDKKKGYFLMSVGFLGTIANQFMKLACRVPRPWVIDPDFTILEQAREAASGYSFPSGHSQTSVGTFGTIAVISKRRWVKTLCIAICILVPFSRMYIGVHTPADVLVGSAMALAFILTLRGITLSEKVGRMKALIGVMLAMALGLLLYTKFWSFPADIDIHNLESAEKNAFTMLGCLTGVAVVYVAERRYIHFETNAVWWAQILKIILGLIVVLAVKEGMRAPLEAIAGNVLVARAIRYFLIVFVAGFLWPLTFHWFGRLGRKT